MKNGTCALATSFIFVAKVRTPFKKTFPANLFLYLFVLYIEVYREVFSCPLTGFLHFYLEGGEGTVAGKMYQCPYTGFFHFYNFYLEYFSSSLGVSMPFNGLSSFLPLSYAELSDAKGVSMSLYGLSSFLPDKETVEEEIIAVSMPLYGLSSFLPLPSGSHYLSGFQRAKFPIIIWQFKNRLFFSLLLVFLKFSLWQGQYSINTKPCLP